MSDYYGPEGLRVRGTVLIVPGRGETASTYARFGARIAADAYRVRVLDAPEIDPDDSASLLDRLAEQVGAAVADLESADPIARPLILVGSDSGAAAVAALVGQGYTAAPGSAASWWPQAVVLAGLPGYGLHDSSSNVWRDELDARTACPVHRAVLTDDANVQRGTLNETFPAALLDTAYGSTADLPHLILVGDSDSYADRDALRRAAKSLPRARLVVVRGAHHDVVNDLQHRSVAAEVVTFLETLRDESSLVPIVTVESSSW
jgi:alpha-beta hydrolase superfamily lysophospholipase